MCFYVDIKIAFKRLLNYEVYYQEIVEKVIQ